ncbi:Membrane associated serine protease, rhomboid family [Rhizobiales bacterium GAS113]|nr:Membrane associated serine protease, rhomboid family [Rhizobiales bacterium GAS113]
MFPIQNAVPSRYPPLATWGLIATNCLVFLFQISLSPDELGEFLMRFALIPARYFTPSFDMSLAPSSYLPFLTNIFLHGGWLHLILNMWTLWLFGGTVEDRQGPARFLAFYLACGVLGSAAHAVVYADSAVPVLGASGAIAGVLGCYIRLFPWARIIAVVPLLFLPLFFEVPAIVFIGFWFVMQVLQGTAELLAPHAGTGVAVWAHIGGFVAGLALGPLLTRSKQRYRAYYADEGKFGFDLMGRQ